MGMETSQVCSFISNPSIPKAEGGGRRGARTTLLAQTRLYPLMLVGVCPRIPCLRSSFRPFILLVDDSILQGSPLPKGPKATPFFYFLGNLSLLSSVVSQISGSDIQDRRENRLKVIMLL